MSKFKQTVIELTDNDRADARASSSGLKNEAARKRGLIDILGARGAMNLFFENKFEVNNLYSMYSIQSVLNDIDIADIYHKNYKFDIRTIFNEEEIFIPKVHFDSDILPDLYLVFKLEKDLSYMEFLGYIEPKNIDKTQSNGEFYFIEKSALLLPPTFENYLKKLEAMDVEPSSEVELAEAQGLFSALIDEEITNSQRHFLLKQLSKNFGLRENFVELENFEMVSKNLVKGGIELQEEATAQTDTAEKLTIALEQDSIEPEIESKQANLSTEAASEDVISLEEFDFNFEELDENIEEAKVEPTVEPTVEPDEETLKETTPLKIKEEEKVTKERIMPDLSLLNEVKKAQSIDDNSFKQIAQNTTQNTTKQEERDLLQALFKTEGLDTAEIHQFDWSSLKLPANRKKIAIAASLAGILLIGSIGTISVVKHKNSEKLALETQMPIPTPEMVTPDGMQPQTNELQGAAQNGVNEMDPSLQKQPASNIQAQGDMGQSLYSALSDGGGVTSISKIAWEVPEELAYNDAFRKYLQTLGKNLKLTLENDLLLTSDIPYSPKIIVDLKISKDGIVNASKVVVSSASKQIDEIVLRSVKEAITYLKPPASEIKNPFFNATLVINF